MLIDITLKLNVDQANEAWSNTNKALLGHLGTHFDVMDEEFPLEYTKRSGIIFDVTGVCGRDIDICDVSPELIVKESFVAFYTGYLDKVGYGTKQYFAEHPQLSDALIELLLDKGVSIIGIDCAGIRRGKEHTPKDRYCAKKGCFVVENLYALDKVLAHSATFTAHTYPMNYVGITGLPCRVIAQI